MVPKRNEVGTKTGRLRIADRSKRTGANVAAGLGDGARMHFTPEERNVGKARAFVAELLLAFPDLRSDGVWLVSELASNAVVHARTDFVVTVRLRPGVIRIEVRDWSRLPATIRDAGKNHTSGRGLGIVNQLASSWGVEPLTDGKLIWLELSV